MMGGGMATVNTRLMGGVLDPQSQHHHHQLLPPAKPQRRFPLQKSHSLDNAVVCTTRGDLENQVETLRREVYTLGEKLYQANVDKDNLQKENQRILSLPPSKQLGRSTDDKQHQQAKQHLKPRSTTADAAQAASYDQVVAKVKEFDRRLKQVSRDFLIKCSVLGDLSSGEGGQQDLLAEYHDAREGWREAELEVGRLKKRLSELQAETIRYQESESQRVGTRQKTTGQKRVSKMELENTSKDVLLEEMKSLEEEVLEVSSQLEAARAEVFTLKEEARRRGVREDESRSEMERREKDLADYAREMENKNALLSNLLEIVQDRANTLHEEYTKLAKITPVGDGSASSTLESRGTVSPLSGVSVGSDEVFVEQTQPPSTVLEEKLRSRVRCLERLLEEERQRVIVTEKKLEIASLEAPCLPANHESQLKQREIEYLKKELDEKDELLEEKETEISDLQGRIEQTVKMNDALRVLVDNEQEENGGKSKQNSSGSPAVDPKHELQIEVISYKKELEDLRNELQKMANRLQEAEKGREKFGKEVKSLSDELRLREEALFEADDELEKKNNEIVNLNRTVEEEQQEMDRIRVDMKSVYEELKAAKQCGEQVEQLTKENGTLTISLEETRVRLAERELEMRQMEEQMRLLSDAVRNRDDRIREKDGHLQHVNHRLQNREKELTDLENLLQQTTYKLNAAESEIRDLRARLAAQDKDFKALTTIVEEVRSTGERQAAEIESLRRASERQRTDQSSLVAQKEREKQLVEEENRRLRQATLNSSSQASPPNIATNFEMEKLKKEMQALRKEKLEQQMTWAKEKHHLERKLAQSKEDSLKDMKLTSTKDPNKMAARISLLSEHISRLNMVQIELKIQNESLQRDIIDYQRRQKNTLQQIETERTKWINEKSLLEMRAKDQEDRKVIITNTRKSLQETALRVADLEAFCNTQKLEFEKTKTILEREKMEIQARLNYYEEKEKAPKRFGRSKSPMKAAEAAWDRERNEYRFRLDSAEKALNKLRSDVSERENKWTMEKQDLLKAADGTRLRLERQLDHLRQQCLQVESARNQVEAYQARLEEYEDSIERERRMWQEERMQLQFKVEEDRLLLDQWLTRVKAALAEFEQSETYEKCDFEPISEDTMNLVEGVRCLIDDMEKFTRMRDKTPFMHLKKSYPMTGSYQESPLSPGPVSPAGTLQRPAFSLLNIGPRTSSLDWTGCQPRMTWSLGRVGRSVSPDVSVRKVTGYPDPPPGFLLKPHSRQSSADSLGSSASIPTGPMVSDYTSRSSTMPNTRPVKCRASPARQKFYDEYDARILQSSTSSIGPPESDERLMASPGTTTTAVTTMGSGNIYTGITSSPVMLDKDTPKSILSSSYSSLPRKGGGSRSISFDPSSSVSQSSASGLPPLGPSQATHSTTHRKF